jgi:hypothetical protein
MVHDGGGLLSYNAEFTQLTQSCRKGFGGAYGFACDSKSKVHQILPHAALRVPQESA